MLFSLSCLEIFLSFNSLQIFIKRDVKYDNKEWQDAFSLKRIGSVN